MLGGILADDMGLGKTLTIIALIFTNHWDGRPLAKPELGYTRPPLTSGLGGRGVKRPPRDKKGKVGAGWKPKGRAEALGVGAKAVPKKTSITNVFDKFKKVADDDDEKENKFSFGGAKKNVGQSSKRFIDDSDSDEDDEESEGSLGDFIDDGESDEFDAMAKNKASSLRVKSEAVFMKAESSSEDEEFRNLSQEDKMLAMIPTALDGNFDPSDADSDPEFDPRLNMDGFMEDSDSDPELKAKKKKPKFVLDSSDEDQEDEVEQEKAKLVKKRSRGEVGGGSSRPSKKVKGGAGASGSESEDSLPDVDDEERSPETSCRDEERIRENTEEGGLDSSHHQVRVKVALILLILLTFLILLTQVLVKADMRPNAETGLKLIVPPKEPADRRGRRRATLIVCPTSLMSHWVEQLHSHLHKSVAVKLKVHHGNQKAFYAADLETHDIVITTYGTLAAEFVHGERSGGPLLRTKWLRVVMDEGHMIKNHLAKCHKAALELDTLRRSGLPRSSSHDLISVLLRL